MKSIWKPWGYLSGLDEDEERSPAPPSRDPSSSSLVRVLSAEGEDRALEQPRVDERLVTRLEVELLLEPEVRRLGVKRLMKSSMVFTGDLSSNLIRTWRNPEEPGRNLVNI